MPNLKTTHRNEYYYKESTWTPQVSHEEFRDRFWNCLSGCGCNDHGTLNLIPPKIDQAAAVEHKAFHGIFAREEKQLYVALIYLAILGVSINIIPSAGFFFDWLNRSNITDEALLPNRQGNLSNAFIPLKLVPHTAGLRAWSID